MDINHLSKLAELVKGNRAIDISKAHGRNGFAIVNLMQTVYNADGTTSQKDVYEGYHRTTIEECTIIDRYGTNMSQLVDESLESNLPDISFNINDRKGIISAYSNRTPYEEGFIIVSRLGVHHNRVSEWTRVNSRLAIVICRHDFNVYLLRRMLLEVPGSIFTTNIPVVIDGPLFEDLKPYPIIHNITLGPVAMRSYRDSCERRAFFENILMHQDNIQILDTEILYYSSCSVDFPVISHKVDVLKLFINHYNIFKIRDIDVRTLEINGENRSAMILLSRLPFLKNVYYSQANNIKLQLSKSVRHNISFLGVYNTVLADNNYPHLDTLEGHIYPALMHGAPNVKKIATDSIEVFGDWSQYIPESVEVLELDIWENKKIVIVEEEFIEGYKHILTLPNLRKVTLLLGIDYPYKPLDRLDIIFEPAFYIDGTLMNFRYYQLMNRWDLQAMFQEDIDKIEIHNARARRINASLLSFVEQHDGSIDELP